MQTSSSSSLTILGIAGSLRRQSFNRRLIDAARELAPSGVRVERFDIGGIPLYNGDLDNDADQPEAVDRFKAAIDAADALLIATPEYNHSIPGVLQNAIDWASRPAMRSPLAGKPVAIMGASPGALGAARAQQTLKLVLSATLANVMPHPGVLVGQAPAKFDADGRLTDERTRAFLRTYLRDLEAWVRRLQPAADRMAA